MHFFANVVTIINQQVDPHSLNSTPPTTSTTGSVSPHETCMELWPLGSLLKDVTRGRPRGVWSLSGVGWDSVGDPVGEDVTACRIVIACCHTAGTRHQTSLQKLIQENKNHVISLMLTEISGNTVSAKKCLSYTWGYDQLTRRCNFCFRFSGPSTER